MRAGNGEGRLRITKHTRAEEGGKREGETLQHTVTLIMTDHKTHTAHEVRTGPRPEEGGNMATRGKRKRRH